MTATKPRVAICMGSTSDWPTMEAAAKTLREFGVPYEARVLSAHRTPEAMVKFGAEAEDAGFEVLIAGAGGAAHLPGMLASMTALPVVGVPVATKDLGGLDSLLSIVQMPRGTPVATVAIGNSTNAAFMALRILGVSDPDVRSKLQEYRTRRAQQVATDDDKLKHEHSE
jgi:5-(carboxyamino)imidazole ribonucleotide mutase